MNRWFAVAASAEIPHGHVAQSQLLGQELVLWRSVSGALNAWENRCPHRGVRLSLGLCAGEELRCQYHAWRFASGSGQCTHIPSHPGQKPAATIRPAVFAVIEDGIFAWVNPTVGSGLAAPAIAGPGIALRSIFITAPVALVRRLLLQGYAQRPVNLVDEFTLDGVLDEAHTLRFMLHPVSEGQTLLHARLRGSQDTEERLAVLRHHHSLMTAVRDRAERAAS